MGIANNFFELQKMINAGINNALQNEVEKVVRQTLKENIIIEVYDKYNPTQYQRTGGLYQDENIQTTRGVNEIIVRSIREEEGRDIAEIIETGVGYTWTSSTIYNMQPFPRPFHATTAQELASSQKHVDALYRGLKRQGFDVRR